VGGFPFDVDWNCSKCRRCPVNGPWKKHTGADLRADPKTEVVAAETGTVKDVYSAGDGWASAILVEHSNGNSKYLTLYMHVDTTLKPGAHVDRGKPIATVAAISDAHLHFGLWMGPYDPKVSENHRGALPACAQGATSCFDGKYNDRCFPQSWVDPMPYLQNSSPQPRVVVSTSLRISQGNAVAPSGAFGMGKIDGTFTVTNRGNSKISMKQLLLAGRLGDTCPNNQCPDFQPMPRNITLEPNQTFSYAGSFTPQRPGTYNFDVVYENQDGKWQWPVNSENGTKNHIIIIVEPGPTLNSANPAQLSASSKRQTVILSGTGLGRTLYCRVVLPNGQVTNIYVPLQQVLNSSSNRIELNTEFRMRGTYYIRAHTLLTYSNELTIQVR